MLKEIKLHFIHETKRKATVKFLFLIAIIFAYFTFLSNKYGTSQGFSIIAISWSFFVLCTPIADGGFIIDFPIRLLPGLRMLYSEMLVWFIAIMLSIYFSIASPEIFQANILTKIFEKIIHNPFPYWIIILISLIGTFLSIYFGDELIDTAKHIHRSKYKKHKHKHHFIILTFLIAATIIFYDMIIKRMGIYF